MFSTFLGFIGGLLMGYGTREGSNLYFGLGLWCFIIAMILIFI
jgi:hypothetical protein